MKNAGLKRFFLLTSAAVIFCLAAELDVSAQGGRSISTINRRIEQITRQSEQFERDRMNREMKTRPDSAQNSKQFEAVKAQIKEDLEAVQSAYNKIVLSMQSGGALRRDFVVETAGNIKKHTERLAENLLLPEPKKDEKPELAAENFDSHRKSLIALCRHIFNFITNPIFDSAKVLDLEQAAKARRELDIIVHLSGKIKDDPGFSN
jgi:hypothetical protein